MFFIAFLVGASNLLADPAFSQCFLVGANAEDVDTCLTVGLHRSLAKWPCKIRDVKNTWFLRGFGP